VYFTRGPIYIFIVSLSFLRRMRNISGKSGRENQNTHSAFSNFFSNIVPFMRQRRKILYSGTGHRWKYGACALYAGYLRPQIHTLRLCNTHDFSNTTMVARTRLIVTLYVHFLSCSKIDVANQKHHHIFICSVKKIIKILLCLGKVSWLHSLAYCLTRLWVLVGVHKG